MRILHFVIGRSSLESPNGADKTIFYLSRSQAALGADVAAFCISPKPVIPIPGVNVRNFTGRPNPLWLPAALRAALLEWNPDFVHLHAPWVPPNLAMARFARRHRIPYLITAHGNLAPRLLRRKPWFKLPYKYLFERPLFNRAAFVHAIADEVAIRGFGVTRPIVTAPNGFDLGDVESAGAEDEILLEFPQFRGKKLLLFLGRLDVEQKGLDLLFEAFSKTSVLDPDCHLVLAGPSWKDGRARLESLGRQLGINERLTFCGVVQGSRKFALIRECHAFLHPSRWEAGVPFAVMEALATGKPCMVSSAADPLGRIEPAGAGLVADLQPEALASAMANLAAATPERLMAMSQAAKELIERDFTWQRSAAIILKACERHSGGQ
jgi:glycosyltransferase involved in cell wall biosynthesis